ncbi:hypothetical protein BH23CHL8_BH23CHL8_17840 [soil metagenome]
MRWRSIFAALYLPPTQAILRVVPLELDAWVRMALVAATLIVAVEAHKLVRRRWPVGGRRLAAARAPSPAAR